MDVCRQTGLRRAFGHCTLFGVCPADAAAAHWRGCGHRCKIGRHGRVWNGHALRARDEKPNVAYVNSKQGDNGWIDTRTVLQAAPDLETARAFINVVMAPENGAMFTDHGRR